MLKVIAQDFIKPEYIETVMPLYRKLHRVPHKKTAFLRYRRISIPIDA